MSRVVRAVTRPPGSPGVAGPDPIVDGPRPAEGNAADRTRGGQEWPLAD
jgi:hypothetical protein